MGCFDLPFVVLWVDYQWFMCCAFVHTLLANSSDDSYIVHVKKSFKRCLDYARHDRCKLIYYYLEKCCFQTYGTSRVNGNLLIINTIDWITCDRWEVIQPIALVHKHLHSSAQCIHTHTASADTYSCKCPVLTGSANPLSGKSSSGCTPVAQRVWIQHQWAEGGHCKRVFPLNGSFLKAV